MNDSAHNPKHAQGMAKPNYRYLPPMPLYLAGEVMRVGAEGDPENGRAPYGPFNWGVAGVNLTVYLDGLQRHLDAIKVGGFLDNGDRGTGMPHLAAIIAGASIALDNWLIGNLVDDRPALKGKTSNMTDLKRRLAEIAHPLQAVPAGIYIEIEPKRGRPKC